MSLEAFEESPTFQERKKTEYGPELRIKLLVYREEIRSEQDKLPYVGSHIEKRENKQENI